MEEQKKDTKATSAKGSNVHGYGNANKYSLTASLQVLHDVCT